MSDTMAIRIANALESLDIDTIIEANPNMYGICGLIEAMLYECDVPKELTSLAQNRLQDIMTTWPKYSGNSYYPIPCPSNKGPEYSDVNVSDSLAESNRAKWAYTNLTRWAGEYGKLRYDALDWLIEYLRANPTCLSIDEYV